MAGGGDQKDNPVAINVVPMVDVIFCLCVFFMCSLKFKQLEGKFDTWLPKDKGVSGPSKDTDLIKEIRIALYWDAALGKTVRKIEDRKFDADADLEQVIKDKRDDFVRLGKTKEEIPVTVDAESLVPWSEVVRVVNMCRRNELGNIEFAFGAKPKS